MEDDSFRFKKRFYAVNYIIMSFNKLNPRIRKVVVKLTPPPLNFFCLNFFPLTDYQKLCYNCSFFVNTYFDPN